MSSLGTHLMPRARRRLRRPLPLYISQISIRDLFGQLSYSDLDFSKSEDRGGRIGVLYGDNGAGKTTILRLIYSAISPEEGAGLRSYIARTPFRYFEIKFSDGTQLQVQKPELIGGFTFRIKQKTSLIEEKISAEPSSNSVREQASLARVEAGLRALGIDVLFVDHARAVRSTYHFLSDLAVDVPAGSQDWLEGTSISHQIYIDMKRRSSREGPPQFPLAGIVDAVNKWFRNQAFRQGTMGEQGASAVYLEIVKALVRRKKRKSPLDESSSDLGDTLQELESVTESFTRHGLLSEYPFQEMLALYATSSRNKKNQISAVLSPFVESVRRRLRALADVHALTTTFEEELNRYLTNKTATFHVLEGLLIRDNNGVIDLESLSSGEKQLVFLLSAAVVSRSSRTLILIDEPELSLNYRWQRLIASSLATLSSSTNTQYILASHSVEIISRHVDSAIELLAK